MYSEESENSLGWTIIPLWGERSWVGVGRVRFMFSKLWFRAGGDSHQTWWRQTLGQAVAVIKLGGGTRWVRRWHTSSFVDAHVRSGGGIHQAWWRQTLSLTEAGLCYRHHSSVWFSFPFWLSSLLWALSPLVFSFRLLVFLFRPLVFLFHALVFCVCEPPMA